MLITSIATQDATAGKPSAILRHVAEAASAAMFARLRAAVAYATYAGTRDFVGALESAMNGWYDVEKYWLISIDFGRTEAHALEFLQSLPNSEVRIPDAPELLRNSLIPQRCFHPKTFIFDAGPRLALPLGVVVGSANLTLSGIHTGAEHASSCVWLSPLRTVERRSFRAAEAELGWFEVAWGKAVPLTRQLLREYERARPSLPKEDVAESVRPFAAATRREVESHPGLAWAHSRCFWIQTAELYKNRGPGMPGNQVDMKRGTRVYFGFPPGAVPRNTVLGQITLQYENLSPTARSVRFGNNSMDKVNMPIPGENGPETYDNSVLHFERIGPRRFRLTLGTAADLARWRRRSERQRLRHELAGGREFGFYT